MRTPLVFAALLLVSCQSADQKKPPEPSLTESEKRTLESARSLKAWEAGIKEAAKITLDEKDGGPCKATVDTDPIVIESDTKQVAWRVVNNCATRKRVAVGTIRKANSTEDSDHYQPLVCSFWPVQPGEDRVIWCQIDDDCRDVDYQYKVCMNGKVVIDPELRIKGRLPGDHGKKCDSIKASTAKWRCELDSSSHDD
jgi:hypothetical protein